MIFGDSVHVAPSGRFGRLIDQLSFWSTIIVKETPEPSGDQAMFDGVFSTRVICVTAPSSSIQRTKTCRP